MLEAAAQRTVTDLSGGASSGVGQSSALIRTGRSGSPHSSSDDDDELPRRDGGGGASLSMIGPRRLAGGGGGGAAALPPPAPARGLACLAASANTSFSSAVAMARDSLIEG